MKDNKKIEKYVNLYTSLGVLWGIVAGLTFGNLVYPDHAILCMCFGISVGMSIGGFIGGTKDKRLSEKMMKVSQMEVVSETLDVMVYVIDKHGVEKGYRVDQKKMKEEQFLIGDRVAEDSDGSLVSLESKEK